MEPYKIPISVSIALDKNQTEAQILLALETISKQLEEIYMAIPEDK